MQLRLARLALNLDALSFTSQVLGSQVYTRLLAFTFKYSLPSRGSMLATSPLSHWQLSG